MCISSIDEGGHGDEALSLEKLEEYEKGFLDLSLFEVYDKLVQGMIHSPEQPRLQLQRDEDPQIFEMLLSSFSAPLKMRDIALPDESLSKNTSLRPFVFNLQRHMLQKVQQYYDSCLIHLAEDKDNAKFAVYQKKPNFFKRESLDMTHTKSNFSPENASEENPSDENATT